jgi:N-acetylglucosaminyldiphosphoundecaprenol N-acetyl-beta-D-mannosaminyltransferase
MTAAGRIELVGVPLDRVTEADAIATVLRGLAEGRGGFVATPNLDHLRRVVRSRALRTLLQEADLIVADGMALVWASRLSGTPLPERVAGSDLVWSLTAEAALHDHGVFLLGGAPGAADGAEARLRALYPGARLLGTLSPAIGFERHEHEVESIVSTLQTARPDIVYVALGFPKQEQLIAYLRTRLPQTWFLGVGFSLSFVAGQVRRAPPWMGRLGLEWLHRLIQEPRRLGRRYLVDGVPFALWLFARCLASGAERRFRGRTDVLAEVSAGPEPGAERVVFAHGALERERARLLEELRSDDGVAQ